MKRTPTPDDFLSFAQIAQALPAWAQWTEKQFIANSKKDESPLQMIRVAGRYSEARWSRKGVIEWSRKAYKHAPELSAQVQAALLALPANE